VRRNRTIAPDRRAGVVLHRADLTAADLAADGIATSVELPARGGTDERAPGGDAAQPGQDLFCGHAPMLPAPGRSRIRASTGGGVAGPGVACGSHSGEQVRRTTLSRTLGPARSEAILLSGPRPAPTGRTGAPAQSRDRPS
jgi:hypothetical protein